MCLFDDVCIPRSRYTKTLEEQTAANEPVPAGWPGVGGSIQRDQLQRYNARENTSNPPVACDLEAFSDRVLVMYMRHSGA